MRNVQKKIVEKIHTFYIQ